MFIQDSLDEIDVLEKKKPRNYRVQIIQEKFADIRIRIRDQQDQLVENINRCVIIKGNCKNLRRNFLTREAEKKDFYFLIEFFQKFLI